MLDNKEIVEKKKMGLAGVTVVTILAIVLVVVGIICVMRLIGKNNVYGRVTGTEAADVGTEKDGLEENQILYTGQVYQLNEDLITVLVMGIDKETVTEVGGQSWDAEGELAG